MRVKFVMFFGKVCDLTAYCQPGANAKTCNILSNIYVTLLYSNLSVTLFM